jgi:hypothetical protein
MVGRNGRGCFRGGWLAVFRIFLFALSKSHHHLKQVGPSVVPPIRLHPATATKPIIIIFPPIISFLGSN